jgi:pyruvate formate lyase activating enzyme
MRIGGLQKFSLIDYPGKVAAVIFTQGCNFRCPYCHNPELVISSSFRDTIPEEEVISFLFERKNKLQGVVVTGGEPTIQPDLIDFLKKIKSMGFCVKLDTNGSSPDVLKKVIEDGFVDFVAMDIKSPLEKYSKASGTDINADNIKESLNIILNSSVEHLFRTTVLKPFLDFDDFVSINNLVKDARRYVLQEFRYQNNILDSNLLDQPQYSEQEFSELKERWEQ